MWADLHADILDLFAEAQHYGLARERIRAWESHGRALALRTDRERDLRYRARHPQRVREQGREHARAYRARHPEQAREASRKWRAKRTPEQRAAEVARVQRWREQNRERARKNNREAQRRRRAKG